MFINTSCKPWSDFSPAIFCLQVGFPSLALLTSRANSIRRNTININPAHYGQGQIATKFSVSLIQTHHYGKILKDRILWQLGLYGSCSLARKPGPLRNARHKEPEWQFPWSTATALQHQHVQFSAEKFHMRGQKFYVLDTPLKKLKGKEKFPADSAQHPEISKKTSVLRSSCLAQIARFPIWKSKTMVTMCLTVLPHKWNHLRHFSSAERRQNCSPSSPWFCTLADIFTDI